MSRADLAAQLRLISQSTDLADVPDEFLDLLQSAAKALEGEHSSVTGDLTGDMRYTTNQSDLDWVSGAALSLLIHVPQDPAERPWPGMQVLHCVNTAERIRHEARIALGYSLPDPDREGMSAAERAAASALRSIARGDA